MTDLSLITWNVGPGKLYDLNRLAKRGTVIGLQEGSDQKAMTKAFGLAHPEWTVFHSRWPGRDAVPMLVRNSLAPEFSVKYHLAVGIRWVGPKGAGLSVYSKRKFITHLTAGNLHILNTHFIPSATKSRKELGDKEYEARRRHFRDHVAALVKLIESLPGQVIVMGDFNAEPDFELLKPLHDIGLVGWSTEGTHGDRNIDHILYRRRNGLWNKVHEVMATSSDHRAVISTFHRTRCCVCSCCTCCQV